MDLLDQGESVLENYIVKSSPKYLKFWQGMNSLNPPGYALYPSPFLSGSPFYVVTCGMHSVI